MSDFDRLRILLLSEEREAIARAEKRLDTLDHAHDELASQLPGLVRKAPARPMADALASPVASALGSAVRNQSKSIVDALFPVIGPLIRKSIAEALRGLMGDINGALEQSLTARGLRWRFEAWRSGVPYAQVVLKHTLRYRIDHLFLIERESGLVLRRESAPGLPDLDADAIAGMLTAIGHFVRDSVGQQSGNSLEEARVGEHLLWVIDGPFASIACFIEGVPPDSLRGLLEQRLEAMHAGIEGVESPGPEHFAEVDLNLVDLARAAAPEDEATSPSRLPVLILMLVAAAVIGWYGVREWRWQARVDTLKTALATHQGFVLTGVDSKVAKALTIRGLLDADATPLLPLAAQAGFEIEPTFALAGYVSTDDAIIVRRARRLLGAPDSVTVDARDGRLRLGGSASAQWIAMARERATWVPGVREVEFATVDDVDPIAVARAALTELSARLAAMPVRFVRDLEPEPEGDAILAALTDGLREAERLAADAALTLRVDVLGANDAPGTSTVNASLRQARAQWLHDALVARGVAAEHLRVVDAQPEAGGATMTFRGAMVRPRIEPDTQ